MKNASYMGANLFYHKSIHSKLYTTYSLNKTKTETIATAMSTDETRTTNVVRNAGCARSRYTLKLSLIF